MHKRSKVLFANQTALSLVSSRADLEVILGCNCSDVSFDLHCLHTIHYGIVR